MNQIPGREAYECIIEKKTAHQLEDFCELVRAPQGVLICYLIVQTILIVILCIILSIAPAYTKLLFICNLVLGTSTFIGLTFSSYVIDWLLTDGSEMLMGLQSMLISWQQKSGKVKLLNSIVEN